MSAFGIPPVKQPHETGLFQAFEEGLAVPVANLFDLFERIKLHSSIFVDRRPDVLAVAGRLDALQLAYARDVGQARLNFLLTRNIYRFTKRIPSGKQDRPPVEAVAVIGKLLSVNAPHVHGQDVFGPAGSHYISG